MATTIKALQLLRVACTLILMPLAHWKMAVLKAASALIMKLSKKKVATAPQTFSTPTYSSRKLPLPESPTLLSL